MHLKVPVQCVMVTERLWFRQNVHTMKILNTKNIPVYIVFLIGICMSLAGYKYALDWEEQRVVSNFNNDAQEIILTATKSIEFDLESLESMKSFYMASTNVDRTEF